MNITSQSDNYNSSYFGYNKFISFSTESTDALDFLNDLSNTDTTGRFNRTLREVVYKDYMTEIRRLQRRLEKMEVRMASLTISVSDLSFQPSSDDKLDKLIRRMDNLKAEVNRHLTAIDADLHSIMDRGPAVRSLSILFVFPQNFIANFLWAKMKLGDVISFSTVLILIVDLK